jgi:predicted esterase
LGRGFIGPNQICCAACGTGLIDRNRQIIVIAASVFCTNAGLELKMVGAQALRAQGELMKRWILAIGECVVVLLMSSSADAITLADFRDFSLRDANNQVLLPGRLYVPASVLSNPGDPHPLMTMLHGGGGNGTDNLAQLNFLSDGMLKAADERGALLYAPQTPSGWGSTVTTARVITMIDRAVSEWNADNRRLFMLGYSNGGGGTWNMLSRYDGRFAAAITMSGVSPGADFAASRLVDTPIVAIHARDDATVPVGISRNIITGILTAGHEPLPTYLPLGNPSAYFVSNANIPTHAVFRDLVHQMGPATDFLIGDPQHDLMYFEAPGG